MTAEGFKKNMTEIRCFLFTHMVIGTVMFMAGCDLAGGISDERVAKNLSCYVPESVARQIVSRDKDVPSDTLSYLSEKCSVGYDETTILLLHPNFPQKRRSELIRRGKSAHYLANASDVQWQTITDEDVAAMLEAKGVNDYLWRQTLECGGLSPDMYRAVYRKWLSCSRGGDLKDNRFLIASANLPTDVREDLLRRLSGVSIASFIIREHKKLSGGGEAAATDVVEYMHVVDGWKRDVSFYVRCDSLRGAGSLYELIRKSKHYSTLDDLLRDVDGKKLLKASDVGRCSRQYEIQ